MRIGGALIAVLTAVLIECENTRVLSNTICLPVVTERRRTLSAATDRARVLSITICSLNATSPTVCFVAARIERRLGTRTSRGPAEGEAYNESTVSTVMENRIKYYEKARLTT